jgi:cytochrome c
MRTPRFGRQVSAPFGGGLGQFTQWLLVVIATAAVTNPAGASEQREVPDAFEACLACHSYQQDEPAQEAPSLWGIVGRNVASAADFEYSPALKALGGTWDRARLDRFLANPKAMVPGTAMKMGGVRDAAERATVLDFLELLAPARPD